MKVMDVQIDTTMLGEFCACLCMFAFLYALLVLGTAIIPYEGSMHNEATYMGRGL